MIKKVIFGEKASGISRSLLLLMFVLKISSFMATARAQSMLLAQPPQYLHVQDKFGIRNALLAGDSKKLLHIITTNKLTPEMKNYTLAAYYRSTFQLDLSNEAAQACYQQGLKMVAADPLPAFNCGSIISGNYNILGQIAKSAYWAAQTKRVVYPAIVHITGNNSFLLPGFGSVKFEDFVDLPSVSRIFDVDGDYVISRSSGRADKSEHNLLDNDKYNDSDSFYFIRLEVNGRSITVPFDTGDTLSTFYPAAAKKLGVRINSSPYVLLSKAFYKAGDNRAAMRLGNVDKLNVITKRGNNLAFKNKTVMVGGHVSAVGLDLATKMGSILIESQKILVHPKDPVLKCDEPLRIASQPMGAYHIIISYPVDGRAQDLMIDTGDNAYIDGTAAATAHRTSNVLHVVHQGDVSGLHDVNYYPAFVKLGLGKYAKVRPIRIYPSEHELYPYVAGAGILRDFDIFIDFDNRKACLIPHELALHR